MAINRAKKSQSPEHMLGGSRNTNLANDADSTSFRHPFKLPKISANADCSQLPQIFISPHRGNAQGARSFNEKRSLQMIQNYA